MVRVTNLTPGSDNPSRAYGQKHQLMTASMVHVTAGMVHVTNLTPGSDSPHHGVGFVQAVARLVPLRHPLDQLLALRLADVSVARLLAVLGRQRGLVQEL
jgi:hypothetical protein